VKFNTVLFRNVNRDLLHTYTLGVIKMADVLRMSACDVEKHKNLLTDKIFFSGSNPKATKIVDYLAEKQN
jgi:hypothetical protein